MREAVESAFPAELVKQYRKQVYEHPLVRQIVSTQVANEMVNSMGITFYNRIGTATGADVNDVVAAYVSARDVYKMPEYQWQLSELDYKVPAELQTELLNSMIGRVRRATRWFLRNRRSELEPAQNCELFSESVQRVIKALPKVMSGAPLTEWEQRYQKLLEAGVPESLALLSASPTYLYSALGISESARASEKPVEEVATVYFRISDELNLHWFGSLIVDLPVDSFWQAQARETSMDDLDSQLSTLAVNILRLSSGEKLDVDSAMSRWSAIMAPAIQRWHNMIAELKVSAVSDFAMFTVALRELMYLAHATADRESLVE